MRIDWRAWLQLPLPTLALGALNLVLLAGVLVVALSDTQAGRLLATPAGPAAPLGIEIAPPAAAPDLAAIQSQPLMHANRAFYSPPARSEPVAPPLPDYRLAGAFIVPKKPAVALLAERGGGATRRVKAGDDLGGWQVQSVEAKRVVLKWETQVREITAAPTATLSAGLKRVPMQRQRVATASGAVVSLGAAGKAAGPSPAAYPGRSYTPGGNAGSGTGVGTGTIDAPRLYRPPPN